MGTSTIFVLFFYGSLVILSTIIGTILKKLVKRKWAYYLLLSIVLIFLFLILPAALVTGYMRDRASGQLTACESNIKNIGTALEMYATDNGGYYSESLDMLTPKYLQSLPKCPVTDLSYGLAVSKNPDAYTVYCSGKNAHKKVRTKKPRIKTGFPQYTSKQGLVIE